MVERVVRVAVVVGGREDGFGRWGEAGMSIERCAAWLRVKVRGASRRRPRVLGMCIAAFWDRCCVVVVRWSRELDGAFGSGMCKRGFSVVVLQGRLETLCFLQLYLEF